MLTENRLLTLLSPFADLQADNFEAFPQTGEEAATRWAAAAAEWSRSLVPVSLTVDAAQEAFRLAMRACTVLNDPSGFARAWHALALALAPGMSGWVGVAPAAPPILEAVFLLGMTRSSNATVLERLAGVLLAWMKTGKATLVASPYTVTAWN